MQLGETEESLGPKKSVGF